MTISTKTIKLLEGIIAPFITAGVISAEEINQLFAAAQKSQTEPAKPSVLVKRRKAAEILNISTRSLDRIIRTQKLGAVRVGKRSIRLNAQEIERYIEVNGGVAK